MPIGNGLPELSVRRPLLAVVLNLLVLLAGLSALFGIEVRELPDVDRPIVTVRASLPGGAPETIDAEVTSVLESAVASVPRVQEVFASSEENSARLRIEFQPGADLDVAATDVREAVNRVTRDLPERVENLFVTKADDDASSVARIAILGDGYSEAELTRLIDTVIGPALLSIDGVAAVDEYGTRQQQMRVTIDPLRLNRFGLTIRDVADALGQAAFDVPIGSFYSDQQQLIVRAEATVATPALIESVLIRDEIRVGDVATALLAPEDASNFRRLNGVPTVGIGVIRRAQANTVSVSNGVRDTVERLNARFDGLNLQVVSDDAVFIRTSIREVLLTLCATTLIVIASIWLFLGGLRATLIPSVAIPLSIMGTLAGIWLAGFSINLITLLALVLATGLIVDDAIVVLENIQRKQAAGYKPAAAAAIGTRQVYFAVIATTAVLVAVFVPISFLPSTTGRLFREFGFVMALAVMLSSFVALSLAPAMASKMQFVAPDRRPSALARIGNGLRSTYMRALDILLARPGLSLLISLTVIAGAVSAYGRIDQELVPQEDRGQIYIRASGPDGVGLNYMTRQADAIEAILQPFLERGEIRSLDTTIGRRDPNRVEVIAKLAPWNERDRGQQDIIADLRAPLSEIPGVRSSVFGRGTLGGGRGGRGGSGLELALLGSDYEGIFRAARGLADAVETQSSILSNVEISYQPTQPQLSIEIDRRRAADLGVPLGEISLTLRAMVGGERVTDLNVGDQSIPIVLEAQTRAVQSPNDLRNLLVRAESGDLLPLSSLTRLVEEGVAGELERVEQRRSIDVEMDTASGVPLSEAIAEFRAIASDALPEGIDYVFEGSAEALENSSRDLSITYTFAIIIVFLALVAQFESITSPIVILLVVPFGVAAGLFALLLTGVSLNIYSQIGLVLLIGLMAKNSILLVEFADQLRGEGQGVAEAVRNAAMIRSRPIVMTVLSTAIGALPLVLSSGAGAEARQSIGWVVFGGLGLAAVFTLFLTPIVYLLMARFSGSRLAATQRLEEELSGAPSIADDQSGPP